MALTVYSTRSNVAISVHGPGLHRPFGFFLGEYEGLTNIGNRFVPAFIAVNNGNAANSTDLFATSAG